MNSVNHVLMLGNLTRDPELRYTPAGTAVCQLGVALNTKGRAVAVEGRLQLDTWETEAGERRSRLKVVAQRVTFLSSAAQQAASTDEPAPDWVTEEAER